MNIHLVEPLNNFTKLQDNVWESGCWKVDEGKAKQLVGGGIYFHKTRSEPSFYGGTILGYRVERDGEDQGRIIFKLEHSKSHRNVSTDKSGWSRDIKITGMNPKESFGNRFRSKLRGVIPSAARDCSTYQSQCASLSELEFHE